MTFSFQRGEKELQEKAEAAQLPAKREAGDGGETGASSGSSERHKREAGDDVETEPSPAVPAQAAANNQQQFSFQLPNQPGLCSNVNTGAVIQKSGSKTSSTGSDAGYDFLEDAKSNDQVKTAVCS